MLRQVFFLFTIVVVDAGPRGRMLRWRGCGLHWRGARSVKTPRITLTYNVLQITPAENMIYYIIYDTLSFVCTHYFTEYSYANYVYANNFFINDIAIYLKGIFVIWLYCICCSWCRSNSLSVWCTFQKQTHIPRSTCRQQCIVPDVHWQITWWKSWPFIPVLDRSVQFSFHLLCLQNSARCVTV